MRKVACEREALIEQARKLREDERLTYRQIGERLGVGATTVNRWLNPDHAKKQNAGSVAWKHAHQEHRAAYASKRASSGVCSRCSGRMSLNHTGGVCLTCRGQDAETRCERIAALWGQGRTSTEIAAVLGTTRGTICSDIMRMREAGWDMPPRRRARQPSPKLVTT